MTSKHFPTQHRETNIFFLLPELLLLLSCPWNWACTFLLAPVQNAACKNPPVTLKRKKDVNLGILFLPVRSVHVNRHVFPNEEDWVKTRWHPELLIRKYFVVSDHRRLTCRVCSSWHCRGGNFNTSYNLNLSPWSHRQYFPTLSRDSAYPHWIRVHVSVWIVLF